jgi:hypothetical protein
LELKIKHKRSLLARKIFSGNDLMVDLQYDYIDLTRELKYAYNKYHCVIVFIYIYIYAEFLLVNLNYF